MPRLTILIHYDDGAEMPALRANTQALGGRVTAFAAYDLFDAMQIAESALDAMVGYHNADQARADIDRLIREAMA